MNLEAAVCMLLFFPLSRKQKARMNLEAAVCLWLIFFLSRNREKQPGHEKFIVLFPGKNVDWSCCHKSRE
jgi:hypothetical protein